MSLNTDIMSESKLFCISFENTTVKANSLYNEQNLPSLVFLVIMFVIGILGNILVLIIYNKKFQRSNYRVYVLFLAGVDTAFCLTVLPFYLLNILFRFSFVWDVLCRAGCFLATYLSLTSLIILVMVAIDRYIVIQKPMRRKIGQIHAMKSCIAAVFLSGVLSWYSLLLYGLREDVINATKIAYCAPIHKLSGINNYILLACSVLLASFFVIAYRGIWSKIKLHARSTRRKTVLIYVAITAVFSLTTIATISLNIFRQNDNGALLCRLGRIWESVIMTFSLVHCLNHVTNPLIYYWRDQRFRTGVQSLFCCPSSMEQPSESDNGSSKSTASARATGTQ